MSLARVLLVAALALCPSLVLAQGKGGIDKLYVIDADSTAANHPGWKKGIRIGSAKDGKVTAFVPGHQTDNPDGAAGEGIVSDPSGNLYAAENTLRGVTKYAKR